MGLTMRREKRSRPGLEYLETKLAMSTGGATAAGAAMHVTSDHSQAALVSRSTIDSAARIMAQKKKLALSGDVTGTYTSKEANPDTGTEYKITAHGVVTPVGAAVVTGSFHTLGFILNGIETGKLTLKGSKGKVYLQLTESIVPIAAKSSDPLPGGVNPGGPMIPASTPSLESEPIVLVYTFNYRITGGTGRYAHDKGTGVVHVTTTPNLITPKGPGIYSTAMLGFTGSGRISLDFSHSLPILPLT
jgi:hypothetical protein